MSVSLSCALEPTISQQHGTGRLLGSGKKPHHLSSYNTKWVTVEILMTVIRVTISQSRQSEVPSSMSTVIDLGSSDHHARQAHHALGI